MLISPFICSFFFLSNKNLCHRFLSSCWSQSLQILYTLRGWPSILCKRNSRCYYLFCLLFQFFIFYHLSFRCNAYGHFSSKISQELLDSGFEILYKALIWQVVLCIKESATYCLSVPLFVHFSFSQTKIYVTDFSAPVEARVFRFCIHLEGGQVYCVKEIQGANIYFAFFFNFSFFYHLSFLCNAYGHFPSKISQELLDLGFWNFVHSFDMTSCTVY